MRPMTVRLLHTVRQCVVQIGRDDVFGLSAELAYRFFLSLFPFFIFLAALGSFIAVAFRVQDPTQQMVDLLGTTLPPEVTGLIRAQLQQIVDGRDPRLLSLGMLAAIVVATSGVNATVKAMNRAYDVPETRPFWKRYLLALGLMLLTGTVLVGAFVLFVAGQILGAQVATAFGLQGPFWTAVSYARWPAIVLLLFVGAVLLYWAAPNIHLRLVWITPGAVLFVAGWLLTTYLFTLYVGNFASYTATYGALGGVVVLLVWFYLTAFVLLVGAELNAVIDAQVDPDTIEEERSRRNLQATARPRRAA